MGVDGVIEGATVDVFGLAEDALEGVVEAFGDSAAAEVDRGAANFDAAQAVVVETEGGELAHGGGHEAAIGGGGVEPVADGGVAVGEVEVVEADGAGDLAVVEDEEA